MRRSLYQSSRIQHHSTAPPYTFELLLLLMKQYTKAINPKTPRLTRRYHFSIARHCAALYLLKTVRYVLIAIAKFQRASGGRNLKAISYESLSRRRVFLHLYQETLKLTQRTVRASPNPSDWYQRSNVGDKIGPSCVKDQPIDWFPESWRPKESKHDKEASYQWHDRSYSLCSNKDILLAEWKSSDAS